jgi:hypothetical protein
MAAVDDDAHIVIVDDIDMVVCISIYNTGLYRDNYHTCLASGNRTFQVELFLLVEEGPGFGLRCGNGLVVAG